MPDNKMSQTEAPWYAAYPAAKSTADPICRSEVRLWLHHSMDGGPRDFVLVDLRRNDHEVRLRASLITSGEVINQERVALSTGPSIYQPKACIQRFRRYSLFYPRRISRRLSGIVVSERHSYLR
jgi:hypothetical protein